MTRPLEFVNTLLLTVIAVLLAILVLAPVTPTSLPGSGGGTSVQELEVPVVDCQVGGLFEEGEQMECIPVRVLDAP